MENQFTLHYDNSFVEQIIILLLSTLTETQMTESSSKGVFKTL